MMKPPLHHADEDGDTTDTDAEEPRVKTERRSAAPRAAAAVRNPPASAPLYAPNSVLAVLLATPPPPPPPPPPELPVPAAFPPREVANTVEMPTKCRLCRHTFNKELAVSGNPEVTCACCERTLPPKRFSTAQRMKGQLARCRTCVCAGPGPLQLIKRNAEQVQQRKDGLLSADEQTLLEKRKAAQEKRKATLARKKREREEEEERRAQLGLVEVSSSSDEEDVMEKSDDHRRMGIAIRNILRDHRSIERRRAANDLRAYRREDYELQLLEEEGKLHRQAAQLWCADPELYDEVRVHVRVVNGAVRYGERDHEQGDFDGDKPPRRAPVLLGGDPGQALLEAAKLTGQRMQVEALAQRPRKRSKQAGSVEVIEDEDEHEVADGDEFTRTTRSGRRPSRASAPIVIDLQDSE